jgi:hypothetical protein
MHKILLINYIYIIYRVPPEMLSFNGMTELS